ncbi:nectin-2 isoform X2 [Spea bombifrons]|uniref:nectin-2 isoform X2 n=1 Tax=Spea bombifrons TaxID=233779 RepID=UPI00234A1449|nr:nectin-2 isoform X2 [Spea bombifrons]
MLLWLVLCGLCGVLQAQDVTTKDKVTGMLGGEVILPCTFTSNDPSVHVSQVIWRRDGVNMAAFSPQHGTHVQDNVRIQFVDPTQTSAAIRITKLLAADEGEYVCEVTTFPAGNRLATTRLTVQATPQNSAAAVSVVAGDQEMTVATCKSANARPPSRITWQTTLNGNVTTDTTNNTDGTFTTISNFRITPAWTADKAKITCVITYESKETQIPLVLSVQYSPVVTIEGYDDNWHLNRNGAYLTCNAQGNPPPTEFTWKTADGSPLPESVHAKGNILYVDQVDERVNKTFLCEVTNALGSRAGHQEVVVREKPNTSGAGATGGIIGGIIAAIVGLAVLGTVLMICRQQRKNQTAKDDEEFEGPPEYKPPPPTLKLQTGQGKEEELLQLKPTVQHIETKDELESTPPKYRQLSESELPSALDDDYREEMNPIYNELAFEEPGSYPRDEQGFMMSPAVYV